MKLDELRCPNCGANFKYEDLFNNTIKCEYCESVFNFDSYHTKFSPAKNTPKIQTGMSAVDIERKRRANMEAYYGQMNKEDGVKLFDPEKKDLLDMITSDRSDVTPTYEYYFSDRKEIMSESHSIKKRFSIVTAIVFIVILCYFIEMMLALGF